MTCILDQADQWLLAHDPELSEKTVTYLQNKRIREEHHCGSAYREEITEQQESQEPVDSDGFLIFAENLNWLDQDVKTLMLGLAQGHTLARIGADLGGISRQAVHARIKKHKVLVKHVLDLWAGKDDPVVPEPGPDIPFVLEKNQQLAFDFGGAQ